MSNKVTVRVNNTTNKVTAKVYQGRIGPQGPAGPNSVTSETVSDGTADLSIASLTSVNTIATTGESALISTAGNLSAITTSGQGSEISTIGASSPIYTTGADSPIYTTGTGSYIQTGDTFKILLDGKNLTLSGNHTDNRAIVFPDADGNLALCSSATGAISSADITFNSAIEISGANSTLSTTGASASIYTTGASASIYTTGENALISTEGNSASIFTSGATANIYTESGFIATGSTFQLNNSTYITTLSHAPSDDRAIAFPDASGTVALTSDITVTPTNTVTLTNKTLTSPTINTGMTFGTGAAAATRTALSVYPEVAVTKTADETKTSTTYANDADLTVALEANSTYLITAYVDFIVNSGGLAFQFVYGGTLDAGIDVNEAFGIFTGNVQGRFVWSAITPPTAAFVSNSGTTPRTHNFHLIVKTANAGNFAVSWSAGTGAGGGSGNVTLKYLSYLTAKKIA